MQAHEYNTLRAVEDRHWWYAVLRRLVLNALTHRLPPRAYVLDAGCGTGGMQVFLQGKIRHLEVAGIDLAEQAVKLCHERGLDSVKHGSVHQLPFEDESFDAVLSLDVLYHAEVDENRAMTEMLRVLRPGGLLVLNLPAFDCLRGSHDDAVCGEKRYSFCHVQSLLARHNMRVEMLHHWNAWLFLPLLCWRQWSRMRVCKGDTARSDLKLPPAWLNHVLDRVGRIDALLCQWLHLPFGSSVFAVARKPSPVQPLS